MVALFHDLSSSNCIHIYFFLEQHAIEIIGGIKDCSEYMFICIFLNWLMTFNVL